MRDDTATCDMTLAVATVTASAIVWEVERFSALVGDPAVSIDEKARAWQRIVRRASLLDVHEAGFERVGVAMKEALCLWLAARACSHDEHGSERETSPR